MDRLELEQRYIVEGASMMDIALSSGCSLNRVVYWMNKYGIKRRSISDAIYKKRNPNGDPFHIKPILTKADAELRGLGVGLYWGEGTKANKHSVRLGNSDPALLRLFIKFLVDLFGVDKKRLRFGLQIFTDIDPSIALQYWSSQLDVHPSQFQKVHVTISQSPGTYRKKSEYGVTTVYFHNTKLRDILVGMLPT